MKNPELLKFVPDHLRTKKLLKNAVKKLPSLITYVPDWYKTQTNVIKQLPSCIKFVCNCYITQNICDKAVNTFIILQ